MLRCLLAQTSAAAGAVKEELNKLLLEKLAEEAKRAHAAQEAIEVCRAAGTPVRPQGQGCLLCFQVQNLLFNECAQSHRPQDKAAGAPW